MTLNRQNYTPQTRKGPTAGQLLFGWLSIFCMALIFKNRVLASESIRRGLLLCAKTVIPSLFPFMVLAELLVCSGMGERLLQKIASPLSRLLCLPISGICAMLLGMLFGFPVGAKAAVSAYRCGALSKRDTERTLSVSNNPSSAFLLGTVGESLWGTPRFGILLYAAILISSLLYGAIDARLEAKKTASKQETVFLSEGPRICQSGAKLFTDSIASASKGIISVCAYVIFFSALMGALNAILLSFHAPHVLNAALFGCMELTGGVEICATLENPFTGAVMSAFACGWSGLSVHCQIISVCDGLNLSFRRYFLAKLLQGILCALFCAIILKFFPTLLLAKGVG